ncbi:glycosyltransferase, partial [bacterium]
VTLHDFGIADPNTAFYIYPEERICPLKPMSLACWKTQCTRTGRKGKAVQMARHLVNGPMLHAWSAFEAFVHVSPFSEGILRSYVPGGRSQVVIDNPVAVDRGPRVEAERNREFVFVGRIVPEKGAVLLAGAAKAAGVPVVFVGDGPEVDAVRAANPDAELAGWLSAEAVQARITGARALVFPSTWYETAGLGALEALARGVPVIVADRCAAAAYVKDGETGRHFPTGDMAALAAALRAHDRRREHAPERVDVDHRLGGIERREVLSEPLARLAVVEEPLEELGLALGVVRVGEPERDRLDSGVRGDLGGEVALTPEESHAQTAVGDPERGGDRHALGAAREPRAVADDDDRADGSPGDRLRRGHYCAPIVWYSKPAASARWRG